MINIKLLRDPQTRQKVYESERKRFKDAGKVTEAYELDQLKIKLMYEKEGIAKEINGANEDMKKKFKEMKIGDKANDHDNMNKINELKETMALKKERKEKLELKLEEVEKKLSFILKNIGNILHDEVVESKDEENNLLIRKWESGVKREGKLAYYDIMEKMGCIDMKRGSKVCGHRGYFLLEELGLLEGALIRYSIDFLREKNFTLIQVPVFLNKDVMAKTAQLSEFDDQLYATEDQYLIATSEQPLTALYMNERLTPAELPKKFCGQSLCFRKEAGAAGKDNKGIFRVHQFEKIEQFVICAPDESDAMHKHMVAISEEFYKSLKLDYKIVSIVSGEMNDSASLKYDLEAFFPNSGRFRELVSCSNCTDYQARDLEVRYGITKENDKKVYCHMLNGTLCAVQRTLCCLVENYQEEGGVRVPEVLVKYFGKDFVPYK